MDFLIRIVSNYPVHKVQKLHAPPLIIVATFTWPVAASRVVNKVVVPCRQSGFPLADCIGAEIQTPGNKAGFFSLGRRQNDRSPQDLALFGLAITYPGFRNPPFFILTESRHIASYDS